MNSGIKKGCLGFIIALAVFGLGAGLSVVIRGKNLKPKSRTLIVSRPERTLDKIRSEFAPDVTDAERRKFEDAYRQLIGDIVKNEAEYQNRFGETAEELARIRSDGKITAEEAQMWIKLVSQTTAEDNAEQGGKKPPGAQK